MADTAALTDLDLRVLRAVRAVEDEGVAATQQAIALRARVLLGPVVDAVNRLFTAGYVTGSLRITDEGRAASGGD